MKEKCNKKTVAQKNLETAVAKLVEGAAAGMIQRIAVSTASFLKAAAKAADGIGLSFERDGFRYKYGEFRGSIKTVLSEVGAIYSRCLKEANAAEAKPDDDYQKIFAEAMERNSATNFKGVKKFTPESKTKKALKATTRRKK